MSKNISILRFISALLLLVFILGITPKRFLHNVFAKHVDMALQKRSDVPYQLNKSGYNCDCNNMVAESSFISDQHVFSFPLFISFSPYIFKNISFCSVTKTYYSLRGPPVNI